jgi:hypothetical protein
MLISIQHIFPEEIEGNQEEIQYAERKALPLLFDARGHGTPCRDSIPT